MHIFQGSYWSGTFGPYMDSFIESAIHRKINVASSNSTFQWIKTKIILLVDRIFSALSSAYQKRYNEINNKIQKNLANESPSTPQVAQVQKVKSAANMAEIINNDTEKPIEIPRKEELKTIPTLLAKTTLIEKSPENHPQASGNTISTSNDSVEDPPKQTELPEITVLTRDHNVEELLPQFPPSPPLENSTIKGQEPTHPKSESFSLVDFTIPTLNNENAFDDEILQLGMTSPSPDPNEADNETVNEITQYIAFNMADEDIIRAMEAQISPSKCLDIISKIRAVNDSIGSLTIPQA